MDGRHAHVGVPHDPADDSQHDRDPEHLGQPGVGAGAGRPGPRGWPRRVSQAPEGRGMSGAVAARLAELGLTLPKVTKPVASYVPAMVTGNLVFTAGQLPFADGALPATGKVGAEVSPEEAQRFARTCALNALAAAESVIGSLDR